MNCSNDVMSIIIIGIANHTQNFHRQSSRHNIICTVDLQYKLLNKVTRLYYNSAGTSKSDITNVIIGFL